MVKNISFVIFLLTGFVFSINVPASTFQKQTEAERLSLDWNSDSINRSISLFSEAANEWEKAGEFRKASDCLREAADLLILSSEYETAFERIQAALIIDKKNNYIDGQIISLSLISRLKNQEGKIDESKEFYTKALKLSESTDSSTAKANAYFSAAEYNLFFGNIKETISLYEKAFVFAGKADAKKLSSRILINLGYSHLREGNLIAGLQKQKDSLAIAEQINDKRGQAIALNGVASLYVFMGEKRRALDIFLQAETLYPTDFDWLEKGKLFNGIATIYENYGEYKLAEKYRQTAFDLFGKAKYPYGQLATLPILARHQFLKGDSLSGKNLYDKGLQMAKELKSDFHIGIIKEDLGKIHFDNKEYEKAISNYQEASQTYEKLNLDLPRIDTLLGQAYLMSGDYPSANERFVSALTRNRQTRDLSPASENLYFLAKLNQIENKPDEALKNIIESLDITETLYSDVTNSKLKSTYLSNIFDRYELYIYLLMQKFKQSPNENYAIQALQAAEKSRARAMLENLTLSEADFVRDADHEIVKREKELRALFNIKSDKLTELLSQKTNQSEIDALDAEIRELNYRLEEIKSELKQKSPIYSAIKNPAPFDVTEFQQTVLDENSLLLEFSLGTHESYLWSIEKNEVNFYILPPREEIEKDIKVLRELLKQHELKAGETVEDFQNRIRESETLFELTAKNLSDKLFRQLAGKLMQKRLIIVPDGALHYFPLAALPLPDSPDKKPLLLNNEVIYEPSAQTLAILSKSQKTNSATKNLLVFSDPIFTSDDPRFSPEKHNPGTDETAEIRNFRFVESLNNLPRLAASKAESETIISIVGSTGTDNFAGFEATRQRLLNLKVNEYKILHFATHGLTDEERPELSGIVLSRFDEQGQKLDEFFRIQDIYGISLNADLVVLSACDTGIGKEVKGEGLMSLNNAFLSVGARSVMSSLWKVEDGAALELMKNFYDAMANERLTPSKALQKAQIKMYQSGRYQSPFYWAAFTVQGDYRNVPDISKKGFGNWIYVLPLAVILALGVFFGYGFIRRRNHK